VQNWIIDQLNLTSVKDGVSGRFRAPAVLTPEKKRTVPFLIYFFIFLIPEDITKNEAEIVPATL
jgi:hypothetical protein